MKLQKKGSATDKSFAEPNNSVNNAMPIHSLAQDKLNCQTTKVIKEWLDSIVESLDKIKALRSTNVYNMELRCILDKELDEIRISSECIQHLAEALGEKLEEEICLVNGYSLYQYRFYYKLKKVFSIIDKRLPGFGEENNSEE